MTKSYKDINIDAKQILVKAKRQDNGNWIEGLLTVMWGVYHIINPSDENTAYPIDTETICRFTGITTPKGQKVWESDIIKHHLSDEVAVIKYGTYKSPFDTPYTAHCGFYVDWDERGTTRKDLGYWTNMVEAEIIGNIYDNPELLDMEN